MQFRAIRIEEYFLYPSDRGYYDYKGSTTKSQNHYFEAGVAWGNGADFKYNLEESRWESFSLTLFGVNLEWTKQSSYQHQFFVGLNTGISAGIGVGGGANIHSGWRWDY